MKLLTYILAFTVIVLSVKPGFDAIQLSEDQTSCCSSTKCTPIADNQDSDDEENQEENSMCNPFQACGSCSLLCSVFPLPSLSTLEIASEHFFGYQTSISSLIISDFWQPPKFV